MVVVEEAEVGATIVEKEIEQIIEIEGTTDLHFVIVTEVETDGLQERALLEEVVDPLPRRAEDARPITDHGIAAMPRLIRMLFEVEETPGAL